MSKIPASAGQGSPPPEPCLQRIENVIRAEFQASMDLGRKSGYMAAESDILRCLQGHIDHAQRNLFPSLPLDSLQRILDEYSWRDPS